jgi:hypothetical protein
LIFVFGPYYSNFSLENFEKWEEPISFPPKNLNFSSQQEYVLLNYTFLDWYSEVRVYFNTTHPIYILIIEDSFVPYEHSTFSNENGMVLYRIPPYESGKYGIIAEGFEGIATVRVILSHSILTKTTYALWGEIMYYGGIGLLVASVGLLVIIWLKRESPPSKQLPKTATPKKTEKRR